MQAHDGSYRLKAPQYSPGTIVLTLLQGVDQVSNCVLSTFFCDPNKVRLVSEAGLLVSLVSPLWLILFTIAVFGSLYCPLCRGIQSLHCPLFRGIPLYLKVSLYALRWHASASFANFSHFMLQNFIKIGLLPPAWLFTVVKIFETHCHGHISVYDFYPFKSLPISFCFVEPPSVIISPNGISSFPFLLYAPLLTTLSWFLSLFSV